MLKLIIQINDDDNKCKNLVFVIGKRSLRFIL